MKAKIIQYKNILLLHLIVVIFGFTAILGKLITIESDLLVWFRMGIATIVLAVFIVFTKASLRMKKGGIWKTVLTGFVIAAHWIFFFESINQSNVSITLAAISSASLFTSILEPIVFKRKVLLYEVILGGAAIVGLYFIFKFELDNKVGLILGLISAALAALFTVINGTLIKQYDSQKISLYELGGGFLAVTAYIIIFKGFPPMSELVLSPSNWMYILILAVICTAFAFVVSVEVMKELTPFTVSLTINLEPIYGIILALIIFGAEEKMSPGFYLGAIIILSTLFANVLIKRRLKKKNAIAPTLID